MHLCSAVVYCSLVTQCQAHFDLHHCQAHWLHHMYHVALQLPLAHPHQSWNFGVAMQHPELLQACIFLCMLLDYQELVSSPLDTWSTIMLKLLGDILMYTTMFPQEFDDCE